MKTQRLALFLSFSGLGGVERMMVNLSHGFAAAGWPVDIVVARTDRTELEDLPAGVRVVPLGTNHTSTSLPALAHYLRLERPAAMLAAKDRAIRVAVLARRLGHAPPRLVGRLGTHVSTALDHQQPAFITRLRYARMRRSYRYLDRIVAVSAGVAADLCTITRLPRERIRVINNPVITPKMLRMGAEPVDHPWLQGGQPPVILGAGRLTQQKDFATLVRAFALVRKAMDCRLVILGEGRLRPALLGLARDLEVADGLDLPGFQANPYAFMARARLFVLSSLWEGSPNVLTEAMALGTPVVATDCPSGPRELLHGGKIAPLVPVADVRRLATAMTAALRRPPKAGILQGAVREYSLEASAAAYIHTLVE